MHNIFIAVGGSGARVAEAVVHLLCSGFPVRRGENGLLVSAQDRLEIWRLDPDIAAHAGTSLQDAVDAYGEVQTLLGGAVREGIASSHWAMDLDTRIRDLDPVLCCSDGQGGADRTLRQILDRQRTGRLSAQSILDAFYEPKDLDITIDRGFFQKPFIGSAVTAVAVETWKDQNSPCGDRVKLSRFQGQPGVNFFVCGSLHGGTGACGVPVIGRAFHEWRQETRESWRIGCCLLGPYFKPPQPPLRPLEPGVELTSELIEEGARLLGEDPGFQNLTPQERRQVAKQILQGFYADPNEMEERARHGLDYFIRHSQADFDEVYLVGKQSPDALVLWSNGGKRQINPPNSAEVVAAQSALNFFAAASPRRGSTFMLAGATEAYERDPSTMRLRDAPEYAIAGPVEPEYVDPEKAFLATAAMRHLVVHQLPWRNAAADWRDGFGARFKGEEATKKQSQSHIRKSTTTIRESVQTAVGAKGWAGDQLATLQPYLDDDVNSVGEITSRLKSGGIFNSREPRAPLTLGDSSIRITSFDFAKWVPDGYDYTDGEYLRFVWSRLYDLAAAQR